MRIQLLGGFRLVADDGQPIDARGLPRKAAAVLKILALQPGHALHRDRLIDWLWPHSGGASPARASLYKSLYVLRSFLERGGISRDVVRLKGNIIALAPGVLIDCDEFRAAATACRTRPSDELLSQALSLYAGTLLEDDLYEEWAQAPREELRGLALTLHLQLGRVEAESGRHAEAITAFQGALDIEPASEEAHCGLMRAFGASGQRDLALRQFARCERALAEDLGAVPSSETVALAEKLRRDSAGSVSAGAAREAPIVRYAQTGDGMRIAYTDEGRGQPLVHLSNIPFNDLLLEFEVTPFRRWHEDLAVGRRYIRYDGRGRGLSSRHGCSLALDTELADLEAVIGATGGREVDVLSVLNSAPVAIAFAARHPGRVRRMVVWQAFAECLPLIATPAAKAGLELLRTDHVLFSNFVVGGTIGLGDPEAAAACQRAVLASADPPFVESWFAPDGWLDVNVAAELDAVRCATLVFEHPNLPLGKEWILQHDLVVGGLPDVHVRARAGTIMAPSVEDHDAVIAAVRGFLDAPTPAARSRPSSVVRERAIAPTA